MPIPDVMTDSGRAALADLPPFVRDDPDVQAIQHALAKEGDRAEATLESVRRNLVPATADSLGLPWWETLLRTTVNPTGATDVDRRARVLTLYSIVFEAPTGGRWETYIFGLGVASYREYDPDDSTGPPVAAIRLVIPYEPGSPAADDIERRVREEAPSHIDVIVDHVGGFILDVDETDAQSFN